MRRKTPVFQQIEAECEVFAAVVNTDGLLVRTEIFEGNRQDVTTLEEGIGSLEENLDTCKHLVVMDAGFSAQPIFSGFVTTDMTS